MSYTGRGESGQGLTEYAMLISLVALLLIVVLIIFGQAVSNLYVRALDALEEAGVISPPDDVAGVTIIDPLPDLPGHCIKTPPATEFSYVGPAENAAAHNCAQFN